MKKFIKENWFKLTIILILLIVSLSILAIIKDISRDNDKIENINYDQLVNSENKKYEDDSSQNIAISKNLEKVDCNDISLDHMAPGYTVEDLNVFLENLNNKDIFKNLSTADSKYILDTYFASQWESVRPECEAYLKNLVESRRIINKQEEQMNDLAEQQQKILDYNQCLTYSDRSYCQYLLY